MVNRPRIYLFDCFARNSGDIGILLATIGALKKKLGGPSIAIESSHPNEVRHYRELESCIIYPKIFNIESFDNRVQKMHALLVGLYDMLSFLLWAILQRIGTRATGVIRSQRRQQAIMLERADVIVSSGGGFLSTNYKHYIVRLYMFSLGKLLGKPVVVMAQSIGPFDTRLSRLLIPFFLKRLSAVVVREPTSRDYLRQFGVDDVKLTADLAFLLPIPSKSTQHKQIRAHTRIAICVKSVSPSASKVQYENAIRALINFLLASNYYVTIVSHVLADDPICKRLASYFDNRVTAKLFGSHPVELVKLYSTCEVVVSSRMHATIFALLAGTPSIAIAYEPKFSGLSKMPGYDNKYMLDEQKLTSHTLLSNVEKLIRHRAQASHTIRDAITQLRQLAQRNLDIIASVANRR